jgi:hypothetical protein
MPLWRAEPHRCTVCCVAFLPVDASLKIAVVAASRRSRIWRGLVADAQQARAH